MPGTRLDEQALSLEPAERLVAHRGWPYRYPENSFSGVRAALETGCRWVEFDVQVSTDGVPFVIHDESLERTSPDTHVIHHTTAETLRQMQVGETLRFGERFSEETLPELGAMLSLCAERGAAGVFVEVKRQSIQHLGVAAVMDPVMDALQASELRSIPISFLPEAVEAARDRGATEVGWVLPRWSSACRRIADTLSPRYLFIRADRIPASEILWPGPWDWVVYGVELPVEALELFRRGVQYVETDDIGGMRQALAEARLRG